MKSVLISVIVILFLFQVSAVSGINISVQNAEINRDSIDNLLSLNLVIDEAREGLSGYNINISIENPQVATITEVTFPSWAILKSNTTLPSDSCILKAVDLEDHVDPGSKNVSLATITIIGNKKGSTDIVINVTHLDSDSRKLTLPSIQSGKINFDSNFLLFEPNSKTNEYENVNFSDTDLEINTDLKLINNNAHQEYITKSQKRDVNPDEDTANWQLLNEISHTPNPNLIVNTSQVPIPISNEFKLVNNESNDKNKIPFGSIVQFSKNGITRVFNSDGKQILVVDDYESNKVFTPHGESPSTYVFEVPSESYVLDEGSIIFVAYHNQRILTIIPAKNVDEVTNKQSATAFAPDLAGVQWIEYDETNTLSSIGEFTATWKVPTNPSNISSTPGYFNTVWIGIQPTDGTKILQPVLEWMWRDYVYSPTPPPRWTIASWYVTTSGIKTHSDRQIGPLTGQRVMGTMYIYGSFWACTIYSPDNQSINPTILNVARNSLPNTNCNAVAVLEAWNVTNPSFAAWDKTFLCGDTLIEYPLLIDQYDMAIDQNGLWNPFVNDCWNISTFMPLSVHNVGQWPNNFQIILNNYDQTEMLPIIEYSSLPTDPDFDEKYEDLNANDRKDFNDVILFSNHLEWIDENEPIPPFDFNNNGRVDFNDLILLFNEL